MTENCQDRGTTGQRRPKSWLDWYRFARETLEYERQEATAYANLRYAEELNRAARSTIPPQRSR